MKSGNQKENMMIIILYDFCIADPQGAPTAPEKKREKREFKLELSCLPL